MYPNLGCWLEPNHACADRPVQFSITTGNQLGGWPVPPGSRTRLGARTARRRIKKNKCPLSMSAAFGHNLEFLFDV